MKLTTGNPHAKLIRLHQPGLNRVEIPSIIGDAPACTECGKAWPCPTVDILQSYNELDDVFDYANYRMSQVFATYGHTMLRAAKVTRDYESNLEDHVTLAAHWSHQWDRIAWQRKFPGATTHIMPLQKTAKTRHEVNQHVTNLVRTLEDFRTGNTPAYYEVTGADRGR